MGLQRGGRAGLNLDAGHVAELVSELAPRFEGRALEACVPAFPRDLVLVFAPSDGEGERAPRPRLRLSAAAEGPRLHLQVARQARPSGPVGPFFRAVDEALAGARLKRLVQLARDRVVALEFEDTPSGEPRSLVLELFGRRANLLLCGRGERLLAVLVPPGESTKAPRLVVGEPWNAPGGPPREPPAGARLAADLEALPAPAVDLEPDPNAPLSWLVETRLGAHVAAEVRERAARDLRARLERRRDRARSLVDGLQRRAAAAGGAERVRQDGDLLKANMGLLRRGLEFVELPDVYSEGTPKRRVELDPRRTPRENVERTYERYKKLLRAQASVEQELARARERLAALEALLGDLEAADADPAALERRALDAGWLDVRQEPDARKRKPAEPRRPYRSFTASRGSEVRVGRTARDNDELTLRHSRGNDLWMHTADAPGSHVVLRLERGAQPDEDEVLDAAHLAVHFSPLREARRANVHVARRKEVHKPRGAKPGLVTLSGGRVLAVRMQPERMQRLLGRSERRKGPDGA